MQLAPDREAVQWLENFVPDSENFDWDEGNIDKNQKHDIEDREIEEIFNEFEYIFAGRIVEPAHNEWRGLILARGEGGRYLALIFARRGEKLRPISCRPMRKEEKRIYEEAI